MDKPHSDRLLDGVYRGSTGAGKTIRLPSQVQAKLSHGVATEASGRNSVPNGCVSHRVSGIEDRMRKRRKSHVERPRSISGDPDAVILYTDEFEFTALISDDCLGRANPLWGCAGLGTGDQFGRKPFGRVV